MQTTRNTYQTPAVEYRGRVESETHLRTTGALEPSTIGRMVAAGDVGFGL